MTYHLLISEEQRHALLEILTGADPEEHSEALEFWPEMLRDLPNSEAESPGVLHGFCL